MCINSTFDAPVDVAKFELLVLASTRLNEKNMHSALPPTWPP